MDEVPPVPRDDDPAAHAWQARELEALLALTEIAESGPIDPPSAADRALVHAAVARAPQPAHDESASKTDRAASIPHDLTRAAGTGAWARYAVAGTLLIASGFGAAVSIVGVNGDHFERGQPETPARVLIIDEDRTLAAWLSRQVAGVRVLGEGSGRAVDYFEAEARSAEQAELEGRALAPELSGLAAIIEFADEHGFGYVAIDPARSGVDLTGAGELATLGELASTRNGVVVIPVGNLVAGSTTTVGQPYPGIRHSPAARRRVALIRGILEQRAVAQARAQTPLFGADAKDAQSESPDSNAGAPGLSAEALGERGLEFRRLHWKLPNYARIAAETIAAWPKLASPLSSGRDPIRLLAKPLEQAHAWPLPTGGALLRTRASSWATDDGERARLEANPAHEGMRIHYAGHTTPHDRSSCGGLPRGPVSAAELSASGTALALLVEDDTLEVHALLRDGVSHCSFELRSRTQLPEQLSHDAQWIEAHPSGTVAMVDRGGQLWLGGPYAPPQAHDTLTDLRLAPVWLDVSTLAFVSLRRDGAPAVHVLELGSPNPDHLPVRNAVILDSQWPVGSDIIELTSLKGELVAAIRTCDGSGCDVERVQIAFERGQLPRSPVVMSREPLVSDWPGSIVEFTFAPDTKQYAFAATRDDQPGRTVLHAGVVSGAASSHLRFPAVEEPRRPQMLGVLPGEVRDLHLSPFAQFLYFRASVPAFGARVTQGYQIELPRSR